MNCRDYIETTVLRINWAQGDVHDDSPLKTRAISDLPWRRWEPAGGHAYRIPRTDHPNPRLYKPVHSI